VATFSDLVVTTRGARYRGHRFACAVGRGGIGTKTGEGDGITPAGVWSLMTPLVRPDRSPLQGRPIRPDMHWCDDIASARYNRLLRALRPDISAERLHRPDPLYDIVVPLSYNTDPVIPGKGSAIFLHIWRKPRHPTEGCVAFAAATLTYILSTWTMRSQVIIRP